MNVSALMQTADRRCERTGHNAETNSSLCEMQTKAPPQSRCTKCQEAFNYRRAYTTHDGDSEATERIAVQEIGRCAHRQPETFPKRQQLHARSSRMRTCGFDQSDAARQTLTF